jgi:hypothetical protein
MDLPDPLHGLFDALDSLIGACLCMLRGCRFIPQYVLTKSRTGKSNRYTYTCQCCRRTTTISGCLRHYEFIASKKPNWKHYKP